MGTCFCFVALGRNVLFYISHFKYAPEMSFKVENVHLHLIHRSYNFPKGCSRCQGRLPKVQYCVYPSVAHIGLYLILKCVFGNGLQMLLVPLSSHV